MRRQVISGRFFPPICVVFLFMTLSLTDRDAQADAEVWRGAVDRAFRRVNESR